MRTFINKIKRSVAWKYSNIRYYYNHIKSTIKGFKQLWKLSSMDIGLKDYYKFKHQTNDALLIINDFIHVMYKKDNNYLIEELDCLACKVDDVENDYNDYRIELSKRIDKLEKIIKESNYNNINDVKIKDYDNYCNELILNEFSAYLVDCIDVYDYDYGQVKRDLLMGLIDCKRYNVSITRNVNNK